MGDWVELGRYVPPQAPLPHSNNRSKLVSISIISAASLSISIFVTYAHLLKSRDQKPSIFRIAYIVAISNIYSKMKLKFSSFVEFLPTF